MVSPTTIPNLLEEDYELGYPYEFLAVTPLFAFRLLLGIIILTSANTYVWFLVLRFPPGFKRLLVALPLVAFFLVYPSLLFRREEHLLMVAMSGFYITWLGSLRILALAFGYSSLAHETSIGTFYLSLFSPFRVLPTNYVNPNSPTPKIQDGFLSLVKGTTKFYLLLLFMYLSYYIGDGFIQRSIIYGAVVYYGASYFSDLSSAVASLIFGLRLMPSFKAPFLSTSLSNFWGRRWNLTYAALHYEFIFTPLENFFAARKKKEIGQLLGVFATFFVTAFFSELVMVHLSNQVTLEWFTFFMIQGPAVIVERMILTATGNKIPGFISGGMCFLFLLLTADLYLWPPMLRVGFANHIFPQYLGILQLKPHG